ncbi:nicotinate phosphoribosyltransferase [Balneola sp. MJW-20]|uniref:nicotinate phosphoribosyltransferase n=1 Tax=Gracilimonas aurantiaca TaxID=3234185 RepID=UPI0038B28340
MAQGYFLSGRHETPASFDYFFRSLPFEGGYVIFAGLSDLQALLEDFTFGVQEIEYLKKVGFRDEFLTYLKNFKFTGSLYSVKEGEVVFPGVPLIRVEGNILECQILETLLLNIVNFESLIATKASRMVQAAEGRSVLDFGLRRSQGLGGIQASKAAVIGGVRASSNVWASHTYNLPVSGTMAHSWIQSFESEYDAFKAYAEHYPDNTTLLVDTYNTLESGVPNAIRVAKELEAKGHQLKAIRLDSGDLAYFARNSRKLLDEAGLEYVKIAVSNQLDEHLIKSLLDQGAPIDLFGVGTKLVTAHDDPALDGVYKLSSFGKKPTLKISENIEKITLPGIKKVLRAYNEDGSFYADVIGLEGEKDTDLIFHPYFSNKKTNLSGYYIKELLHCVIDEGKTLIEASAPNEAARFAAEQLKRLQPEHKRFANPHVYKVGITGGLMSLRDELINQKNQ